MFTNRAAISIAGGHPETAAPPAFGLSILLKKASLPESARGYPSLPPLSLVCSDSMYIACAPLFVGEAQKLRFDCKRFNQWWFSVISAIHNPLVMHRGERCPRE